MNVFTAIRIGVSQKGGAVRWEKTTAEGVERGGREGWMEGRQDGWMEERKDRRMAGVRRQRKGAKGAKGGGGSHHCASGV
jgi:hypothetical protein